MTQTHNPLPVADASFISALTTFLESEDADRFVDQFQAFVVSGGTHPTGAGLTHAPTALVAYAAGEYITESGSITYTNAVTTFVIATAALTGNVGTYTRVAGTHYLIDATGTTLPALPSGAVQLMKVVTSGGAVTAVSDLRPTSPVRRLYNFGMVFSSAYTSLQAAIDALPAEGGIVFVEPGTYTLTETLRIGNGAAATMSTRQGVHLVGMGVPGHNQFGFTDTSPVRLVWAGGADPMISVLGPIAGWGIENLSLDGAEEASHGILVTSGQDGFVRNVVIRGCLIAGLATTTVSTFGGSTNTSCLHNKFENIFIISAGTYGIDLTGGSASAPTNFNEFSNVMVEVTGNGIGMRLGAAADNVFHNLHFLLSGGATSPLTFAYDNGISASWPASNYFYGLEPHNVVIASTGAAAAGLAPNFIVGFRPATDIDIEGVAVIFTDGDGNINFITSRVAANATPVGNVVVVSNASYVTHFVPSITNVSDLGAPLFRWRTLYVGGMAAAIATKTAATYDLGLADQTILADTTANVVTVTLPLAANATGKLYTLKRITAGANAAVLEGNGAELIDGAANVSLAAQWDAVTVQSNGTAWYITAIGP